MIHGISESFDEVGTNLNLLCEVNRTKPESSDMFWMINGQRKNGSDVTLKNEDGTFAQKNSIEHRLNHLVLYVWILTVSTIQIPKHIRFVAGSLE